LIGACTGDDPGAGIHTTAMVEESVVTTSQGNPFPAALTLRLGGGASISADGAVGVELRGPPGMAYAQISVNPTFAGAAWRPLREITSIEILDGGYQMVFARGREPDGAAGQTVVAGVEIDLDWSSATASADGGPHRPSWARLVAPEVLQVRVETGRTIRQGAPPDDLLVGRMLSIDDLDDPASYLVDGAAVAAVSRITRPNGRAELGHDQVSPVQHDLFLTLSSPLSLGTRHVLGFDGPRIEDLEFAVDPIRTTSPAVHINQLGFAPGDGGKVAQVSAWTGRGGGIRYPAELPFTVNDAATGEEVLRGVTTMRTAGATGEAGRGDLTGAEVHEAEFSDLDRPGRYRVCLMIGCSPAFVVSGQQTWLRGAAVVARAMYHQRSGIALGQPYTSVVRPRSFHPADGSRFHQTELTMIDDPENIGGDDRFDEYRASDTGATTDAAWGGHYDAGDWNSRIQHLAYLRVALDLVREFPSTFGTLDLNIPESDDAIPDLIDEGLWDLDHFLRLQDDTGGIPGNVDQERFAERDETSWANEIDSYVFAPDVWSTYIYAGVAAEAAVVLSGYDAARADVYAASARRAMEWAEQRWAEFGHGDAALISAVEAQRAVAAAAMLWLTSESRWDDVFAAASSFDDTAEPLLDCPGPLCDAAWIYGRIDAGAVTPTTQTNSVESLLRNADAALQTQRTTAYGWVIEHPDVPFVYGLGPSIPHGIGLLRAYLLSGEVRYRTAMVRGAAFALGSNPLNTSFVTGIGAQPARYPLIVDSLHGGLPVWPGTFVFGIHDLSFSASDDWVEEYVLEPAGTTPPAPEVPLLWSWYDVGPVPMMNEFTVSGAHAPALWTLGVLAATH
jgi:endoglucanase